MSMTPPVNHRSWSKRFAIAGNTIWMPFNYQICQQQIFQIWKVLFLKQRGIHRSSISIIRVSLGITELKQSN
jgi:hypothetical protein